MIMKLLDLLTYLFLSEGQKQLRNYYLSKKKKKIERKNRKRIDNIEFEKIRKEREIFNKRQRLYF